MFKKIFVCIFLFSVSLFSQKKELTVERIYTPPSLNGKSPIKLKWSPDSKKVCYLKSSEGSSVMDLWAFDVEKKQESTLVKSEDVIKGQQEFSKEELAMRERMRVTHLGITDYIWAPDGNHIMFPVNGDFYDYVIATKEVKRLTKTEQYELDPKYSPDGNYISFVRDGNIFIVEIKTGKEIQLTTGATDKIKNGISEFVAQEEMDRFTGYWWSSDSKKIAYLQIDNTKVPEFHIPDYVQNWVGVEKQEYPKAGENNTVIKVGVVSIGDSKTTWMNLGNDTDIYIPRVDWLSDSKKLSIQLQTRNQDTLDVHFFDIETGKSNLILRETEPNWVNLHDDLYLFKDGKQFLWSSERSGHRHFYLYDINGKLQKQITNGNWDVIELVGVDEKNKTLYFTSTEKSILENHLYKISIDGKGLKRITEKEGWHTSEISSDFNYYLDSYSNMTTPNQVSLNKVDGKFVAFIEENIVKELSEYNLGKHEFLTIKSEDGETLYGMIIKPPDFDPNKKYPVIIYTYGGPHAQVVNNSWQRADRYLWHQMMVQKGFIIFSLDNRGSARRGKIFESKIHKQMCYWEVKDQVAGVNYLKSLPYIDGDRIGIWGWSYGGYMTLMCLLTQPDVFKIGVSVAPVTDWRNYDTHYTERYLERPQDNSEGYKISSPVNYARNLKGKLLLVHGMADDNVHFQDTVQMIDEFIKAGKQFNLMIYPGKAHGISGAETRIHLYNMITEFFIRNL